MPANLPPAYFEAEQRMREARSSAEKIACLEEMLTIMPKHKGTDKLRADLRRRIAKLKDASQARKGPGRQESVYSIGREGAGQVVVAGPANVGKSSLIGVLTNAKPEVADFPHTTWKPTPGMMPYENIQIQLIDTPPLTRQFVEAELIDLLRRADLILLMVDLQTDPLSQLADTAALLIENRVIPRHLQDRFQAQRGQRVIPMVVLANKCDDAAMEETFEIFRQLLEEPWPVVAGSAAKGRNLEHLKRLLVEQLEIIRVYSKAPGKLPDRSAPFTLKKGGTVGDFAGRVHKDFTEKLKGARVWGTGVFDGQMVQRDHVLHDGDVVELRI